VDQPGRTKKRRKGRRGAEEPNGHSHAGNDIALILGRGCFFRGKGEMPDLGAELTEGLGKKETLKSASNGGRRANECRRAGTVNATARRGSFSRLKIGRLRILGGLRIRRVKREVTR